ncbi:MAG: hypothetical protein ACN6NT_09505, partial [Comamonas sp.]
MSAILPPTTSNEIVPVSSAADSSAPSTLRYYRFKPWNVGRVLVWSVFAILLIAAPHVFTSSLALT